MTGAKQVFWRGHSVKVPWSHWDNSEKQVFLHGESSEPKKNGAALSLNSGSQWALHEFWHSLPTSRAAFHGCRSASIPQKAMISRAHDMWWAKERITNNVFGCITSVFHLWMGYYNILNRVLCYILFNVIAGKHILKGRANFVFFLKVFNTFSIFHSNIPFFVFSLSHFTI